MNILNLADKSPARLLASLRGILTAAGNSIHIELTGPGSLLPDTALMLFHELRAGSKSRHIHIHSHTCLFDGSILVWLASNSRSIRPDAWIQVSEIPDEVMESGQTDRYYPTALCAEECPQDTDMRNVLTYMNEYLPVSEIAGLRVFPADLCELGILNPAGEGDPIAGYFFSAPNALDPEQTPPKSKKRPHNHKRSSKTI